MEPTTPCPPNLVGTRKKQFYKANVVVERFQRILAQLTALAKQSVQRFEETANNHRSPAPRYTTGQEVYIDTKNMKTNQPMKKGDDRWVGPYPIRADYPRACLIELPTNMKIFPVFHNSLLRPKSESDGVPG